MAPLEKKHASSQVNPYIIFSFSDCLFSHDLISFISSLTDRVICIVSLVVYVHLHNQSLIYNQLVLNTNFFEPHVSLIYIMYFYILELKKCIFAFVLLYGHWTVRGSTPNCISYCLVGRITFWLLLCK